MDGDLREYYYYGNMLVYETMPSPYTDERLSRIKYLYDESGSPTGFYYLNGFSYFRFYFVKNLQGDVIQLRNDFVGLIATYEYDVWGRVLSVKDADGNEITDPTHIGLINPIRYRGYYYDSETALYYLQSRYYDPMLGRFISPDDTVYLGADGSPTSYNLYAYCGNNPVMFSDPTGQFGIVLAIIATGAIVGGLLGAFSAAATGGNVLESTIEGCLTGALGATCGILITNPIVAIGVATIGGAAIDFTTQVTTQYIENKSVDLSKVDYGRVAKTGTQTGISTAIPALGEGAGNALDAFGTALIWAEASTVITCTDIVVTNVIAKARSSSKSTSIYRRNISIYRREMLLI